VVGDVAVRVHHDDRTACAQERVGGTVGAGHAAVGVREQRDGQPVLGREALLASTSPDEMPTTAGVGIALA
jgi:hypothetical protein